MEQYLNKEAFQAASRFLTALDRLVSFASENDTQIGTDDLDFLIARVRAARPGFPLLCDVRPAQRIDRLGSVLLGPIYTSKAHPLPLDSEGNPMAPLYQLNTAQLPLPGEGVEGLVQVGLTSTGVAHGDSLIRVITTTEVNAAEMTGGHGRALVDKKASDYTQGPHHLALEVAYVHWHCMLFSRFLTENGWLLWESGVPVSIGYCRNTLDNHLDTAIVAKSHWEMAAVRCIC